MDIKHFSMSLKHLSMPLLCIEQDFSFALKLFNEHILKPEAQKTKSAAAPPVDPSSGSNGKDGKSKKNRTGEAPPPTGSKRAPTAANGKTSSTKDSRPPIIIVPSALSGIISSINAADFLENSTYVPIEDKRKAGAPREKERYISRILSGGIRSKYLLIDSPKLSPKDWDRVVAVFATGQGWQFKDWPVGFSNPVELFSKVSDRLRLYLWCWRSVGSYSASEEGWKYSVTDRIQMCPSVLQLPHTSLYAV